ncbi:adhesion G protein-coupled receptor A1 isoform X2 [Micropterus dolomieu]|uniref:adhesion G protein-coupled receptor A1 isoform X2 n=1 Tax=Micropterus dolomieu TaxID=147949 RepID=UPI001E8CA78B|nr:adhesion G protein-coupled receptor A1 isoform X2 [Micropterus dolomieu]
MDLKRVLSFPPYPGDYLHPVVYACTAVMLLCLLVSIMTYIVHHSVIRISRNGWHTLLNFLFHTGLTFGVFATGINQINLPFVCQIVGIVLHYASLSTMLWLTFTARNICKDVSKDPLRAKDKNGTAQTRTKPTILRFYLVSDGIPLIIVGVTAACGMDNYGSRDDALYCWMAWEPSLGGFYAPISLLVLVMSVYFLCTYIQLKRHPERKYELRVLSEEQQQLSSSESNHHCHIDAGGAPGSAGDCLPFATGLFLLIQHCAKRDDVWHRWWACCPSKSKTKEENGDGQSQRQELHQPHCQLSSPCSSKQPLLSPHLVQSSYHKMSPPQQSLTPNHTGPCYVAVTTPLTEPLPSPRPLSLSDEIPRPALPLQSCLNNRTKSRSFNRPRPCLQDYRSHMTSTSMDGSVHSSHLDSPHAVQHLEGSPLVSNSPHPDLQLPCPSPHLDKQVASCQSLQRQTSCHSVQDSLTSCHSHAHNMHDSITSCHSLLQPSHGVHTCQWHMYSSAGHSSTTSCCEKPDPFSLQYQQDPDTYNCMSKATDKKKDNLCIEDEQKGFPRNTLPRQHGTVSRRGTIGRNRSLQEDGLFGSDAIGNIRTGPWKNETTV